jgi:hypothetical protein
LSHHDTKTCVLSYEKLMSGVRNLEVTACITSAYVVSKVQGHGNDRVLPTRSVTGYGAARRV